MKRLLLTYIILLFTSLSLIGQVNQIWYKKGKVLYAVPVAGIDSVTYGQFVSADTFLIVIDRASRRIVYDTIDVHVPGMVYHDTIHTTHTVHLKPGRRIGVFSVAKDKQVSFSQGNLQYVQNQNVWKFADQQYEMIGARNVKDGQLANKIDLFGWSANNTTAPFGVSTSTNNADYSGDFVDWGTNVINYESPNTWRTLSIDEWEYLINERDKALELYGVANVAGVNGLIILPDNWVLPEGLTFQSGFANGDGDMYFRQHQIFTEEEWLLLETAGAIFLPAAGIVMPPNTIVAPNLGAHYQSSNRWDNDNNYWFGFRSSYYTIQSQESCMLRSVRLVHDTIVPQSCESITINVNNVSFNMVCVEGGTFMMGAMEGDTKANANEKPTHEVTLTHNYHIGQTEVTQALWKAVMGNDNNPSTIKGDNLPVNNVLWGDAMTFIYKLNQITGLSFDLPTEAEWEFAARGGNKSKGYLYAGSNNASDIAWNSSNSGGTTHSVATKQPNELGIYDMSGNVFEWCKDWLAPYSAESQVNPKGPISGEYHVYRGGGWYLANIYCRSSHRRQTKAGYTEAALGFRVVLREKVEPEYVDLGLSVKWATFNIGATTPEEYGDYFAWGETEPKAKYGWAQYKWGNGENKALTKYCNKAAYGEDGFTDNLTQLLPEDDAAHVNWGGNWRMPTAAEFDELINNCTIEKTTMNGANGYLLTSKINGNSIFLPMAGCYNFDLQQDKLYENNSILYYWSADMWYNDNNYNINAYNLSSRLAEDGYLSISSNTRRCGFPIRPIYDDNIIPNPCLVVKINDTLSINMTCVEGGTFTMGDDSSDNTSPAHQVTLSDYYIGQTEVTQALWRAIMGTNPSNNKGDNLPVAKITWDEAQPFIEKLNKKTSLNFRLPTEAEWEYAAMGGKFNQGYKYPGSDNIDQVAWYGVNSNNKLHVVGTKMPNELGIYDMSGNVWEWVSDWYGNYSAEEQINPQGPSSGTNRVLRSGSYVTQAARCAIKYRQARQADHPDVHIGFRIVLDPEPHTYVDLGLSVLWATCNVGAESPEDYGDY